MAASSVAQHGQRRVHTPAGPVHWRQAVPQRPRESETPDETQSDQTSAPVEEADDSLGPPPWQDLLKERKAVAVKSKEVAEKEKAEAKRAKLNRKATNSAAGMVGWKPRSERDLRQRLEEKEHDPEAIEAAVTRVQELGMQSDREYAEIFVQSKWRQQRWAPARIRGELLSKGLTAADINAALQGVFGDDMAVSVPRAGYEDEDDDEHVTTDTRYDPKHHLIQGVKRQAELSRGLKSDTRKRRLIMWLQRRGHNWDTISTLLTHVDLT